MPPNVTSPSSVAASSSSQPPALAAAKRAPETSQTAGSHDSSSNSSSRRVFSHTSNAVTAETSVIEFGKSYHATGICFLDHMVDQLTSHGQLGVTMKVSVAAAAAAKDDDAANGASPTQHHHQPHVDYAGGSLTERPHDEDIFRACGASLGKALQDLVARRTIQEGRKTARATSTFLCPLDEALAEVKLTLSSEHENSGSDAAAVSCNLAPYGSMPPKIGRRWIGCYRCHLTPTFFEALVVELGWVRSLDLQKMRGHNAHHVVESTFKAFARCFRACLDELTMGGKHGCVEAGEDRLVARRHEEAARAAASGSTDGGNPSHGSRTGSRSRSTKETTIEVHVDLDRRAPVNGATASGISTGVELTDAILGELRSRAGFWFTVRCDGDIYIDDHHTSEDVAITLGQCLNQALGSKAGLARMGCAVASCGTATVRCTLDLSNRPYFEWDLPLDEEYVGGDEEAFAAMRRGACARNEAGDAATMLCGSALTCEMLQHVFESLTIETRATVHLELMAAEGYRPSVGHTHDLALAAARALGTALAECVRIDPRRAGTVASSKGTLSV